MDRKTRTGKALSHAQRQQLTKPRKAKEYSAWWEKVVAAGQAEEDVTREVATMMLEEVELIAKIRQAQTDEAIVAIIREQGVKWRAFTRRVKAPIKRNGFGIMLRDCMAELWNELDEETREQLLWE